MPEHTHYMIKDAAGRIYGPVTIEMLRQWSAEHSFLASLIGSTQIAAAGTEDWQPASSHPQLGDVIASFQLSSQRISNSPRILNYSASATTEAPYPLALFSVLCGAAGVLSSCVFFISVPLGAAALWMGFRAQKKLREDPALRGQELAILGIVTGAFSAIIGMVIGMMWLGMVLSASLSAGYGPPPP